MKFDQLYQALHPLNIVLKAFGLFYCKISTLNQFIQYEKSCISVIFSICLQCGSISITLDHILIPRSYKSYFYISVFSVVHFEIPSVRRWRISQMFVCLAICNAILMGLIVILNIFREKYVVKGLHYLYRSRTKEIEKYKSKWNYFSTCCIILAFTFLTVLTTLVLHFVNYIILLRKKISPIEFVIYAIPTFTKSLYISQFTAYIFVLYLEFKDLNESLVKMQFVEEDVKDCLAMRKGIVSIRRRHELLCLSGKSLNRGFSVQLLFIIAADFVIFVMDLYFWYVNLIVEHFKRRSGHAIHTAVFAVFALHVLARIVVISGVCAVTKQEAQRSLDLCLKIGLLHDRRVSNEINLFVQQIEHWEFGFHAMEFFKIDLTLIYSTIRSAMMFLLIFIQLDGTN